MGVRFIEGTYDGTKEGATALVDSVTGFAFGPIFDSYEDAQAFLDWLPKDVRTYGPDPLKEMHRRWTRTKKEAPA